MADVNVRTTRFALTTAAAGNTQDVTISGFGTPKAAIFTWSEAGTNDVVANTRTFFGVGFAANGSGQSAFSIYATGNNSPQTNASRAASSSNCIVYADPAGGTGYASSFSAAFITDGVRLTVTKAISSARLVNVIFINGNDVSNVHVDSKAIGSTTGVFDIATVGFEPDLVFIGGIGNGTDNRSAEHAIFSLGAGYNDGLDTQRMIAVSSVDVVTTSVNNAYTSSSYITGQIFNDATSWLASVQDYDASGFSLNRTANPNNDIVYYLCLKFTNNPDIALFDVTFPTIGNYAETAPGFTPGFGFTAATVGVSSQGSLATNNNFGISVAAFDSSAIYTTNATSKDDVLDQVAAGLSSDSLRILDDDGVTNSVVASGYAFDADGWDFTLTTNPASPVLGFGLAIGAGGAPPVGIKEMYIKDGGIFVKYTPHVKVGGTFQEVDAYVLEGGAWVPVHEK